MGIRFRQVNLAVRDIADAVAFYRLLGFDVPDAYEWPDGSGAHHVEVFVGDELVLALDDLAMISIWHPGFADDARSSSPVVGLQVDARQEVDELCAVVRKAGYAVVVEPYDAFWGSRYAVVADPDGHHVGLRSNIDEAARHVPPVD